MDTSFDLKNTSVNEGYDSFTSDNVDDENQQFKDKNLKSFGKHKVLNANVEKAQISNKNGNDNEERNNAAGAKPKQPLKSVLPKNVDVNSMEERLQLHHLKMLKKIFLSKNQELYSVDLLHKKFIAESLSKNEFVELISGYLRSAQYDGELEKLFHKLDSKNIGRVTWNDFCNHLLNYFSQKSYSDSLKVKPFINEVKIKHSPHNKLSVTAKLVNLNNPLKFVNISRTGAVGIWNKNLTFHKKFKTDQDAHERPLFISKNEISKFTTWITDAIMIEKIHKLIISTSARELRIFSISNEHFAEETCIYGLPYPPLSLDYCFNESNQNGLLLIGCEFGNIELLRFINPLNTLFNPVHYAIKGLTRILWMEINKFHKEFAASTSFKTQHCEGIRRIKYIQATNLVISASSDSKASVIISNLERTKKSYVFQMTKGCVCFDFSKNLNLLVTGTSDGLVKLWDPFVTANPIAKLNGHRSLVVDVKIHEEFDYLYSYSSDGILIVWDITDHELIQKIRLNFPSILNGKIAEYGGFPMHLYIDSNAPQSGMLTVACDDYIALLEIGDSSKLVFSGYKSHEAPITAMIYSPMLKQVVTGSDDSSISFWNIDNGSEILKIKNAHGNEEITALNMDDTQRRLFSAARDGSVKVWNMVNGCNMQTYIGIDNNEVVGLFYVDERKMVLSVGWSRKIASYSDEPDMLVLKPRIFGINQTQHNDDIICGDSYDNMLATGSYDGSIYVWNTDSEKLFISLQKGFKDSYSSKIRKIGIGISDGAKQDLNDDEYFYPIDKLMFLKYRINLFGLRAGILVSSSNGRLYFWSLYSNQKCLGSFYASNFPNEVVSALCTDNKNEYLVAGDSNGFLYIWDIQDYLVQPFLLETASPRRLNAWKCHDTSIISCQFIDSNESSYGIHLILTASTDFCCKLWTINGKLIGIFGQKTKWAVSNEQTYAHFNPFEIKNNEEDRVSYKIILGAIAAFKSIVKTESNDNDNQKLSEINETSHQNSASSSKLSSNKTQKLLKYDYLSSIQYFKLNDKPIKNPTTVSSNNLSKYERHQLYSHIDGKLVSRMPNVCTPHISLKLPTVDHLETNIQLSMTENMKKYGFKLPNMKNE